MLTHILCGQTQTPCLVTGAYISYTTRNPSNKEHKKLSLILIGNYRHLTIKLTTTVTKVLFADRHSSGDKLAATGVEFLWGLYSSCAYEAYAWKEVILSAGTIKDLQILSLVSFSASTSMLTSIFLVLVKKYRSMFWLVPTHLFSKMIPNNIEN